MAGHTTAHYGIMAVWAAVPARHRGVRPPDGGGSLTEPRLAQVLLFLFLKCPRVSAGRREGAVTPRTERSRTHGY